MTYLLNILFIFKGELLVPLRLFREQCRVGKFKFIRNSQFRSLLQALAQNSGGDTKFDNLKIGGYDTPSVNGNTLFPCALKSNAI